MGGMYPKGIFGKEPKYLQWTKKEKKNLKEMKRESL